MPVPEGLAFIYLFLHFAVASVFKLLLFLLFHLMVSFGLGFGFWLFKTCLCVDLDVVELAL